MATERGPWTENIIVAGAIVAAFVTIGKFLAWVLKRIRALMSLYTDYENNTLLLKKIDQDIALQGQQFGDRIETVRRQLILTDGLVEATANRNPDGLWRSDANGRATWLNPALLQMMGMTIDEARGDGWRAAIHHADRERVYEEWDDAISQHRVFRSTYRYQTGIRINAVTYVIRDPEHLDVIIGYVGLVNRVPEEDA